MKTSKNILFLCVLILQLISLYKYFINNMYIGQFVVLLLLFIVLSKYNKKLIFIDCLLIFSSVILLTFMKENKMLKNSDNFDNDNDNDNDNQLEGFKNNKIKEFMINQKVKKSDSNLNQFQKNKNKETFETHKEPGEYYKSFEIPELQKKYKGSVKTFSKKFPIYIDKLKEIFR